MLYLKSLFNTKSLPDWFVTINILDLTLAIVCWPFVLFMTMVAFTDHHGTGKPLTGISKIFDMIVFFVIISYPIYIVSMTIINYRLYHRHRTISIVLSLLPLIIATIIGIFYLYTSS
jgi:hypothetical protein